MKEYFQKRKNSFGYAFNGLKVLFKTQAHAQIHAIVSILTLILGIFLKISVIEWCLIAICMAIVLAAEAINTALEFLTDLVSPNHHPLAGKVKDIAAGAVLLAAIGAVIVGIFIFLPKLSGLF